MSCISLHPRGISDSGSSDSEGPPGLSPERHNLHHNNAASRTERPSNDGKDIALPPNLWEKVEALSETKSKERRRPICPMPVDTVYGEKTKGKSGKCKDGKVFVAKKNTQMVKEME